MRFHFQENLSVLYYKHKHLSSHGRIAIFLFVLCVLLTLFPAFSLIPAIIAISTTYLSITVLLSQNFLSYVGQLESQYTNCNNSDEFIGFLENLKTDKTPAFEIETLPSSSKISHSNGINVDLINQIDLGFELHKDFEKRTLKRWSESRSKLTDFLIYKAQAQGYLFNEQKVALMSNVYPKRGLIHLGKTSYYCSLLTNEASGKVLSNIDTTVNFNNMIPQVDGELIDIASSGFSNHIGVTLLALTADNNLVFWIQNSNAQISINSVVSTGSGSLDWNDISNSGSDDLLGVIRYGMARELAEESSIKKNKIKDLAKDDILVTGFFRWVERGGKPEFVGICRTDIPTAGFISNKAEVNEQQGSKVAQKPLIQSMTELHDICDKYLQDPDMKIGVSTEYLLYQLRDIASNTESPEYKTIKSFWELT